jgi:hypothetical protein
MPRIFTYKNGGKNNPNAKIKAIAKALKRDKKVASESDKKIGEQYVKLDVPKGG